MRVGVELSRPYRMRKGLILTPFGAYAQSQYDRRLRFGAQLGTLEDSGNEPLRIELSVQRHMRPGNLTYRQLDIRGVVNLHRQARHWLHGTIRTGGCPRQRLRPRKRAGALPERIRLDTHVLEHRDEQVAERCVVFTLVLDVRAVGEAAAGDENRQIDRRV